MESTINNCFLFFFFFYLILEMYSKTAFLDWILDCNYLFWIFIAEFFSWLPFFTLLASSHVADKNDVIQATVCEWSDISGRMDLLTMIMWELSTECGSDCSFGVIRMGSPKVGIEISFLMISNWPLATSTLEAMIGRLLTPIIFLIPRWNCMFQRKSVELEMEFQFEINAWNSYKWTMRGTTATGGNRPDRHSPNNRMLWIAFCKRFD